MVLQKSSISRETGRIYIVKHRYYVNAERNRIVPENSSEATYLLANKGGEILESEAIRLGIIEMEKEEFKNATATQPHEKVEETEIPIKEKTKNEKMGLEPKNKMISKEELQDK